MCEPVECKRCNGSGEYAASSVTLAYLAPGPVPDDASGYVVLTCDECRGMGYVEEAA